ncbi:hypothetical protein [Mycobacterium sp. ENV421]|uniref:hypothetical protein n=1 Tax=Mycobacterium sp. ENV421 TaxID=1213407 RepID=UPI00115A9044|nr:hypothetical protein [Mycobacterium sp. ENV421]
MIEPQSNAGARLEFRGNGDGEVVITGDGVLSAEMTSPGHRERLRLHSAQSRLVMDRRSRILDAPESRSRPPAARSPALVRQVVSSISADRFEQQMVEFVIRWSQYGGGSAADIFVEFGLSEIEFFRRVLALIEAASFCLDVDRGVHQRIRRVCMARLGGWSSPGTWCMMSSCDSSM